MKWNLEPIDMLIHAAIAAAFVLIGVGAGYITGLHFLSWIFAAVAIVVFGVREGLQQMKKARPPEAFWMVWQWGPRGIAEWVCVIPTAICVAILAGVLL